MNINAFFLSVFSLSFVSMHAYVSMRAHSHHRHLNSVRNISHTTEELSFFFFFEHVIVLVILYIFIIL